MKYFRGQIKYLNEQPKERGVNMSIPKSLSRPVSRMALALIVATMVMAAQRRPDNLPDTPLQAPDGVTALSGQVVDLDGRGLPGVELSVGSTRTLSDEQGRFLLSYVIPGMTVLQIDARRAGPMQAVDYGYYQARVETIPGRTTIIPFKTWLPKIDHSHDVKIFSPTRSEIVVKTPSIPGFELLIPAGTIIRDVDGKIVHSIGITAIPPDRTPIPLPDNFEIPTFFTIQPGAACIYDAKGGIGTALIVYPNFDKELPKARAVLWRYDPGANGWTSYGTGTVSQDGRQLIPDADAGVSNFSSAECAPSTQSRQPSHERHPPVPRSEKAPRLDKAQ